MYKEGDELSKKRIDDLQPLLRELSLTGTVTDTYFESNNFPIETYLEFKRVSTDATDECCTSPRSMTVYLAEEANVPLILRDPLKNPSFEWGETFCTMLDNRIRIYRNTDFNIVNLPLTILVLFLTAILFALMGFINAIFADSFDDISVIPTFVLTPLIYLGGVFYSINILPDIWRSISLANPMLYVVNTFREGMLGISDVSISFSLSMIGLFIFILTTACLYLLNKGIGIRE